MAHEDHSIFFRISIEKLSAQKIDLLNIVLIFVSFALAVTLPVRLFLFSYAILGPLHYLTEIGWLDKRNYFSKRRNDVWILAILTALLSIGYFLSNSNLATGENNSQFLDLLIGIYTDFGASIVFFAFGSAMTMVLINRSKIRYLSILLIGLLSLFIQHIEPIYIIFGVFVPTIIHVSIFTALFMLFGALKNKSLLGYISVGLFLFGCGAVFLINANPANVSASQDDLQMLLDSSFIHIGAVLSEFIGLREVGSDYMLLTKFGIQIQTLFAFCYTYHYLNWFSKTKIINWHEVSKTWLILTAILWTLSLVLYSIDYKIGFMALFFLSMLHVFFEFPLNNLSIIGIFQELKSRIV